MIFAAIAFPVLSIEGQVTRPGIPFPLNHPLIKPLLVYDIEIAAEEREKALSAENESLLKSARSGLLIRINLNPDQCGNWDKLPDGTRVWRLAIHARGSSALNLIINPYRVNKGVKIFLYDPMQQVIRGAFTDMNNRDQGILATSYIPGEMLVVEMQVPHYCESFGSFTVESAGVDFAGSKTEKSLKDGWFGLSGECNADINCFQEAEIQQLKDAVVRIVYSGTERCTGVLVNNTLQDSRNYLITAGHCITSEYLANTAVFFFDYESPFCDGGDGDSHKSISGATLRARSDKVDFALLELLEPVPFTYHPYYAGWDATDNRPAHGFAIHHPLGDVKKIAVENHPLSVSSYGSYFNDNTHWLVSHWEVGTTEMGSSGAPFFNPDSRISGTLTGGMADCVNPVNDYFQMFSHCWADYEDEQEQLKYWLDPERTGTKLLDGFDPHEDFWKTGDTLTNISPDEPLVVQDYGLLWGSLSGHNSSRLDQFAEHYAISGTKSVLGVLLYVADNYVSSASSVIRVRLWHDGELPGTLYYEKEVFLADLAENKENFIEFDSVVTVAEGFYAGYKIFYNSQQDTFSTFMAENRTASPISTAYISDGYQWQTLEGYTGGAVHSSLAVFPVVFNSIPGSAEWPGGNANVLVYPNPASEEIRIEFREMKPAPVSIALFNLQGQLMTEKTFGPYQNLIRLNTGNISTGIYLLRVKQDTEVNHFKITLIK
jgi:hypothetical protein